jgi:hypothetical protein
MINGGAFLVYCGEKWRLRPVFLRGGGNRFEDGAPAAFADLIRKDEIVGRLTGLLAFQRYGWRHAAHAQSLRNRRPLYPLDEFHGHVPVMI